VIELLLEAERALSFGRVDEAERLYRQVATADPANSIAVVGLARVALEHADDAGAYVLARQALTIDPENEAAKRLVTRLDEVMRTRGETVPEAAARIPAEPALPGEPVVGPSAPEPEALPPVRRRSFIDRLRGR
jgi:thioredoxin-like negative regulator of GroEL